MESLLSKRAFITKSSLNRQLFSSWI